MQLSLSLLAVLLLGATATAQKTGPNGKRICVGGAISCQYEKGRCANICGDSFVNGQGTPAFIDPNCSCPEGQADNRMAKILKMPYDTELSTTATVFDTEDDNGIWTFADFTGDGSLDLVYIKTRATDSGKVELHAASRSSAFQDRTANTPTAFDAVNEDPAASGHTFLLRDWTGDGRADLILVKTRDTPGGKVELHVAAADTDYQAYALQTETAFDCEDGGAWTMTYPRGDHLVYLKTRDCGSGMVEVHAAGRGGGYQSHDRGEPTAFEAEENGTWCLAPRAVDDGEGGGGLADLYYVKTRETDSGVVEVHAATAESGWQDRPLGIVSSFAPGEDGHWVLADLNGGDVPDLVYVKVRDTDSGKVEIHTNEV
ncbi:hypothetical protein K4K56_009168 [Colletotrichum sp. SAR 10_98]|nr:hypothetical protein K4K56_009168 [Colletotrichum sp. SAR 10_98]